MQRFKNLINAMPENEQAFTSKKETWNKYLNEDTSVSKILKSLFGDNDEVEISRYDLFNYAKQKDLNGFVVATLLWGYPSGMRGNHFSNITNEMESLIKVLNEAKLGVKDWPLHYEKVKDIRGLGLSTYTKYLYFLGVKVKGYPALIFDDRIIRTMNKGLFTEFESLNKVKSHNAVGNYPAYLKNMDEVANKLGLKHGKLEMFLFEFGLNLKLINT